MCLGSRVSKVVLSAKIRTQSNKHVGVLLVTIDDDEGRTFTTRFNFEMEVEQKDRENLVKVEPCAIEWNTDSEQMSLEYSLNKIRRVEMKEEPVSPYAVLSPSSAGIGETEMARDADTVHPVFMFSSQQISQRQSALNHDETCLQKLYNKRQLTNNMTDDIETFSALKPSNLACDDGDLPTVAGQNIKFAKCDTDENQNVEIISDSDSDADICQSLKDQSPCFETGNDFTTLPPHSSHLPIPTGLPFSTKLLMLSKKAKDDFAQCLSSVPSPFSTISHYPLHGLDTKCDRRKNSSTLENILRDTCSDGHFSNSQVDTTVYGYSESGFETCSYSQNEFENPVSQNNKNNNKGNDRDSTCIVNMELEQQNSCILEPKPKNSPCLETLLKNGFHHKRKGPVNTVSQTVQISSDHVLHAIQSNELAKMNGEQSEMTEDKREAWLHLADERTKSDCSTNDLGSMLKMLLTKNWMLTDNKVHFLADGNKYTNKSDDRRPRTGAADIMMDMKQKKELVKFLNIAPKYSACKPNGLVCKMDSLPSNFKAKNRNTFMNNNPNYLLKEYLLSDDDSDSVDESDDNDLDYIPSEDSDDDYEGKQWIPKKRSQKVLSKTVNDTSLLQKLKRAAEYPANFHGRQFHQIGDNSALRQKYESAKQAEHNYRRYVQMYSGVSTENNKETISVSVGDNLHKSNGKLDSDSVQKNFDEGSDISQNQKPESDCRDKTKSDSESPGLLRSLLTQADLKIESYRAKMLDSPCLRNLLNKSILCTLSNEGKHKYSSKEWNGNDNTVNYRLASENNDGLDTAVTDVMTNGTRKVNEFDDVTSSKPDSPVESVFNNVTSKPDSQVDCIFDDVTSSKPDSSVDSIFVEVQAYEPVLNGDQETKTLVSRVIEHAEPPSTENDGRFICRKRKSTPHKLVKSRYCISEMGRDILSTSRIAEDTYMHQSPDLQSNPREYSQPTQSDIYIDYDCYSDSSDSTDEQEVPAVVENHRNDIDTCVLPVHENHLVGQEEDVPLFKDGTSDNSTINSTSSMTGGDTDNDLVGLDIQNDSYSTSKITSHFNSNSSQFSSLTAVNSIKFEEDVTMKCSSATRIGSDNCLSRCMKASTNRPFVRCHFETEATESISRDKSSKYTSSDVCDEKSKNFDKIIVKSEPITRGYPDDYIQPCTVNDKIEVTSEPNVTGYVEELVYPYNMDHMNMVEKIAGCHSSSIHSIHGTNIENISNKIPTELANTHSVSAPPMTGNGKGHNSCHSDRSKKRLCFEQLNKICGSINVGSSECTINEITADVRRNRADAQIKIEPCSEAYDEQFENTHLGNNDWVQPEINEKSHFTSTGSSLYFRGQKSFQVERNIQLPAYFTDLHNDVKLKSESCDIYKNWTSRTLCTDNNNFHDDSHHEGRPILSVPSAMGLSQKRELEGDISYDNVVSQTSSDIGQQYGIPTSNGWSGRHWVNEIPKYSDGLNGIYDANSKLSEISPSKMSLLTEIAMNSQRNTSMPAADMLKGLAMFKMQGEGMKSDESENVSRAHDVANTAQFKLMELSRRKSQTVSPHGCYSSRLKNQMDVSCRSELAMMLTRKRNGDYCNNVPPTKKINMDQYNSSKLLEYASRRICNSNVEKYEEESNILENIHYKSETEQMFMSEKKKLWDGHPGQFTNFSSSRSRPELEQSTSNRTNAFEESILANLLLQPPNPSGQHIHTKIDTSIPNIPQQEQFSECMPLLRGLLGEDTGMERNMQIPHQDNSFAFQVQHTNGGHVDGSNVSHSNSWIKQEPNW